MRQTLKYLFIAAVFVSTVNLACLSKGAQDRVSRSPMISPTELWEQAIAAKGGRERLKQVKNLLVYSEKTKGYVELNVFPDKHWLWSFAPPPIGLAVSMFNGERQLHYLTYPDDPTSPRKLTSTSNPVYDLERAQIIFLVETNWVKPVILSAEIAQLEGKKVDLVKVKINDKPMGFHLDRVTHLPVRISYYRNDGTEFDSVSLADYKLIQGVNLPLRVSYNFLIDRPHYLKHAFQINVDYNPKLFETPPTVEAGPDAWKPLAR